MAKKKRCTEIRHMPERTGRKSVKPEASSGESRGKRTDGNGLLKKTKSIITGMGRYGQKENMRLV
jgi:hypothetical protein